MALFRTGDTVYTCKDIIGLPKGTEAKVMAVLDGTHMSDYMAKKKGLTVYIKGKGTVKQIKVKVKLTNPPTYIKNPVLTLSENCFK
ncbi:hypothetical protein [Leptolyngbya phage Lbo-JY46]